MRGNVGQQQANGEVDGGFIIKNQIELKDGRAQRVRLLGGQTNAVKYNRYTGFRGVWFFILDTLGNWDNLFLFIFTGANFAADTEIELTAYTPIILLIINIVV